MTRNEELQERYEDALFALLMDEVAEAEGQQYLEENIKLRDDPNSEVPAQLDEKCRKIIRRSFSKNKRREAGRAIKIAFNRAAVIVFASLILFSTAYAFVPELRVKTINLLIEVSDVATGLSFGSNISEITSEINENTHYGYVFPEVPEGFRVVDEGSDNRSVWIRYENDVGGVISFDIGGSDTSISYVDTENADNVETIIIHGFEGLLIEKDDRVHIVWGDTEQTKFVNVICNKLKKDVVIKIASDMRP